MSKKYVPVEKLKKVREIMLEGSVAEVFRQMDNLIASAVELPALTGKPESGPSEGESR